VLDLNEIVRGTEGLLRRVIGEHVHLEHATHRGEVLVSADRTQLEQVILNLVVNAQDAMPDGGRVTIEVDEVDVAADHTLDLEPGRFALLSVSDTGPGIDPGATSHIFEPFFTTKADGTGLGLATVHGIVTQSGGTIWVYSEPGAGATFKVYLPLSAVAAAEPAVTATPVSRHGGGEHVLVVEDDRQVRAIVKQMLVQRGFVVTAAEGPEGALAAALEASATFDVILSDLVMPEMGGRELVAQLRIHHPDAAVLYMSGYSDDAVRRRGVLDPGTAFIEKPFSSDALVNRLRALIDTREAAA
jgi:two-component system, cell cycle sensor histidine kinase and response regulator CckA